MGFLTAEGGKLEVERMTTATAKVFSPIAANLVSDDEVAQQHARQWVPNHCEGGL
jgi:hypothetical protein